MDFNLTVVKSEYVRGYVQSLNYYDMDIIFIMLKEEVQKRIHIIVSTIKLELLKTPFLIAADIKKCPKFWFLNFCAVYI